MVVSCARRRGGTHAEARNDVDDQTRRGDGNDGARLQRVGNGKVVGDLRVSVGGAFWRPKHGKEYLRLTWEQVDALFKKDGQPTPVGEYKFSPPAPGGYDDAEVRTSALADGGG